jgi:putative membrane protein
VVVVLGILVLFPVLMMALAVPTMGMMGWWGDGMMGWWGDGMMGGFSPLWGIVMMLVWLIVLLGIGYLLYRGLVGGLGTSAETDSALEELRLAYARGDLSDEEFEERRSRLQREE